MKMKNINNKNTYINKKIYNNKKEKYINKQMY